MPAKKVKRKKRHAKLKSGRLKERVVQEQIEENAKVLEETASKQRVQRQNFKSFFVRISTFSLSLCPD